MHESAGENITELLRKVQAGEPAARAQLIAEVYPELRRLAGAIMRRERAGHTLQPTAIVHEVYLRLAGGLAGGATGGEGIEWQNRAHFFAVSAQVMRQILVDHARKWAAVKRGGGRQRLDLNETLIATEGNADVVLAVNQALDRLDELDARQARVVEMRFFGGMTEEEIAAVMGVNVRTVKRDWSMAKAWLHGQLQRRGPGDDA